MAPAMIVLSKCFSRRHRVAIVPIDAQQRRSFFRRKWESTFMLHLPSAGDRKK